MTPEQQRQYNDMVYTPIERLILRKAVPSILSLLVMSIYNLVDTFFVGRLGTSATGAVGIVFPLMNFVHAVGLFFGKGTGTMLGRLLGQKNTEKAERVVIQGMVQVLAAVGILTAVCMIFSHQVASLLGTTESMRPYVITYMRWIMIGMPFYAAGTMLNFVLNFQGYSARSMIGTASGAILNMILDPILIFWAGLGVAGAAIATMIGEVLTFFIMYAQCSREGCLPIRLRNFSFSLEESMEIWRGGLSSFLKNTLSSVATVLLNTAARPYGDAVIAAFSIVNRLVHIVQQIYFGLGEGFQAVVSYNYGAGQYARVKKGFWFCMKLGLAFIPIAVLSFFFGDELIRVFRDDADVIRYGALILFLQLASSAVLPPCFNGFVMLQGIGKNLHATIVGVGRQGMFLVPLLLVLPRLFGLPGLIAVQPVSDTMSMILSLAVLRTDLKEFDRLEREKKDSSGEETSDDEDQ